MAHGATQAKVALGTGYLVSDLAASPADLDDAVEDLEAAVVEHAEAVTDVHGAVDPVEVSLDDHTHA